MINPNLHPFIKENICLCKAEFLTNPREHNLRNLDYNFLFILCENTLSSPAYF